MKFEKCWSLVVALAVLLLFPRVAVLARSTPFPELAVPIQRAPVEDAAERDRAFRIFTFCRPFGLQVRRFPPEASALEEAKIEDHVRSRLVDAGLVIARRAHETLSIEVALSSETYLVAVDFAREVDIPMIPGFAPHETVVSVWRGDFFGRLPAGSDPLPVLTDALDGLVDYFADQFAVANDGYCDGWAPAAAGAPTLPGE